VDISNTIAPKSDQLNADDLLSGPRTVRIVRVKAGTAEQPVELHLDGLDGRPYKPGKSMRRVLIALWGSDADTYVGRSLTLYNDQRVKFGSDVTGGIRISHASNIDRTVTIALTVTRGRRAPFTVEPLKADPLIELLQSASTLDALKGAWEQVARQGKSNMPELIQVKDARKAELTTEPGATA
jgi:hypothetical protein